MSESHDFDSVSPCPTFQSDVRDILVGFKLLKGNSSDEVLQGKTIADAFLEIVREPANVKFCIAKLFPNAVPLDQAFFDTLGEFRRWIGVAESADEAIGILWSDAMIRLSVDDKLSLLQFFASQKTYDFFRDLRSLHVVVKNHLLPTRFVADWFTTLVQFVEGDVSDGVWRSIIALCEAKPTCALEVIWALTQPPEKRRLNIAAVMLGTLRRMSLEEHSSDFEKVSSFFANHSDSQFRSVYNWSWPTTARANGVDASQLQALLARSASGSSDDLDSVVSVVCCVCKSATLTTDVFVLGTDWIGKQIDASLPATAKYHVANAAADLSFPNSDHGKPRPHCSEWIIGIQPVDGAEVGTWSEIRRYLQGLANDDTHEFRRVFECLCASSADAIHGLMQQSRGFDSLFQQLGASELGEMVGRLTTSFKASTRRLGIFLFDKLSITAIPSVALGANRGLGRRLLFYEIQRTILGARSLARLFVSMLRSLDPSDDVFRKDLVEEMKLQSRNFAGGCRQELNERGADLPEVIDTLQSVDQHFQRLKVAHESGVNAMEVAGQRHAARLYRRRLSQQVSEGAMDYSPLLGMMKSVYLPYGRASGAFVNEELQDAIPLVPMSTSIEIPIVDFCDPEEMAMRRIHASAAIQRLLKEEGASWEEEHE